MKTGRAIHWDKACYGIEVFNYEIYTTQHADSGPGEVQILELSGNRKRKLQTDVKLDCPYYITINRSSKKIFVSSGANDIATVTCTTTDGNLVYQFKDKELSFPRYVYVDVEDTVELQWLEHLWDHEN